MLPPHKDVSTDDVVLDCKGFKVNYGGAGVGILINGRENVTIKNCVIDGSLANPGSPMVLNDTNSSFILNTSFSVSAQFSQGIILKRSSNNLLANNTIISTDQGPTGIHLNVSSNNTISNNDITINVSFTGNGIDITTSSNNNKILNNSIKMFSPTAGLNISVIRVIGRDGAISGTSIIQNNVSHNDRGRAGIDLDSFVHNSTVSLNVVNMSAAATVNALRGIIVQANGGASSLGNQILNNTVSTGTRGTGTDHVGIEIVGAKNTTIQFNKIRTNGTGSSALGILSSAVNTSVINNTYFSANAVDLNFSGVDGVRLIDSLEGVSNFSFVNVGSLTIEEAAGTITFLNNSLTQSGQNISRIIQVSNRTIFVNSSGAPGFNVSAQLTMNSVTFSDPKATIDLEDDGSFVNCLEPQCVEESFTGGAFVFNVSGFTTFQAAEGTTPNVTDLTPPNESTFSIGATIEIGANVTDDGTVSNVSINVTLPNGTIVEANLTHQGATDFFNTSFTIPQLNGTYTVLFIANDTDNNFNETEVTIFVGNDTFSPAVVVVQPANDTVFNQSDVVTITVNVTSATGVTKVNATITFDGSTAFVNLTPAGGDLFQANFTNTTFVGDYNFSIAAFDGNGNVNNTVGGNFTVRDSLSPNVQNLTPANGTVFDVGTTIEIRANVTDNSAGVGNVSINITQPDSSVVQINLTHQTGDIFNTSFTIPQLNGTHNNSDFCFIEVIVSIICYK